MYVSCIITGMVTNGILPEYSCPKDEKIISPVQYITIFFVCIGYRHQRFPGKVLVRTYMYVWLYLLFLFGDVTPFRGLVGKVQTAKRIVNLYDRTS